jgi:2-polyprenyl-6-methoxyphenol hydroxylase-like FAD-dependent oxidoreductase
MTKKALIIGGGIAGPVTVNGLEALRVLDLHEVVGGLGMATPQMQIRSGTGKLLAQFANPSRTLKRADLYQALRDEAVRRGVGFEYGKRLTDATITRDGVFATFADGGTALGDLLIGADGLRSRTRSIIDPKAPAAHHIGLLNTGGYARGLNLPDEKGVCHFIFGKRCFFGYMIHPNGEVWWFANPPSKREPTPGELAAISQAQWRTRLMNLFEGDSGPILDIIRATPEIVSGWNTYDFPKVPAWHNDRMVIIGDAAHATSPSSGQGASQAIEDSVVLAKCLRDIPDTRAAFDAYERLRRERVEKVVAQGRRNGTGKAPGPVGRWIRDLVLPPIMRSIAKKNSLAWMYDYRIDWNAPIA